MKYSRALRVGILKKVLQPDGKSIGEISRETGISDQTIRNWLKQHGSGKLSGETAESCPRVMTAKEKYQVLLEAASLKEDERGGFLRERGLHSEHLTIWDQELREMIEKKVDPRDQELKALKKRVRELEKDLQFKEKALAETAALLVLKKKLQAFMTEHEEG